MAWYGNQNQLESDFIVAPKADPRAIELTVEDPAKVAVDHDGHLTIGGLKLLKPVIYQQEGNQRRVIAGRYALAESKSLHRRVSFEVASYDRAKPLVIDPGVTLSYSTYLGGSTSDAGAGIAVDSSGSAYVTGSTSSVDFPTQNPFQAALKSAPDAFVTKFSPSGTSLVYSTYLGGSGFDSGFGIAVDSSGSAYVSGSTESTDFPTMNPFQSTLKGTEDAFVTKLSTGGSSLVYSTYLGGTNFDSGLRIAVDSSGSAYVTGVTSSADFPTQSAFQSSLKGSSNGFVTKFSSSGTTLVYSTYLGGSTFDEGIGIAVDSSSNAYITGVTESSNFPTQTPFQSSNGTCLGSSCSITGFVTEVDPAGSALVFSTYLGGSLADEPIGIAVDSTGSAYVTGVTLSPDFPTQTPFQASLQSAIGNAFVTKFSPGGTSLVYSTFLGGSASSSTCSLGIGDVGFDIALDSTNNAYVTGSTCSFDFPIHDAFQGGLKDPMHGDAFVTKLSPDGTSLIYSTFLGGTGAGTSGDLAEGIAVDSSGNAYVTGSAASTNFPTQNAFQGANKAPSGSTNAFVTKFAAFGPTPTPTPTATVTPTPTATPTPSLAALTAAPSSATLKAKVGKSKSKKVKLTNKKKTASGASINITSATVATAVFAASTNCNGAVLAPGKSCSVTVTFTPSSATTFADTLTVSSNAANGVQKTTLSGVGH